MKSFNSLQILHLLWDPWKKEKKRQITPTNATTATIQIINIVWNDMCMLVSLKFIAVIIASLASQFLSVNHAYVVLYVAVVFLKKD